MAQVPTPTDVTVRIVQSNKKQVLIGWKGEDEGGNGKFAFRFARRGNPDKIESPVEEPQAVGQPAKGQPWSQTITLPSEAKAKEYVDQWQAQVRALADDDEESSQWGRQIYWVFGFTLTVKVGEHPVTLAQLPGSESTYRLARPITIRWADVKAFAEKMHVQHIPSQYPNGHEIGASLTLQTFELDVSRKLFKLELSLNLGWDDFLPGFEIEKMGLLVERSENGSTKTSGTQTSGNQTSGTQTAGTQTTPASQAG